MNNKTPNNNVLELNEEFFVFKSHKYYKIIKEKIEQLCNKYWTNIEKALNYDVTLSPEIQELEKTKEFVNMLIFVEAMSLLQNFTLFKVDHAKEKITKSKAVPGSDIFNQLLEAPFMLATISNALLFEDSKRIIELLKETARDYSWLKNYSSKTISSNNNNKGRKSRFKDENRFQNEIKKISNWQSLNRTQLAVKLGYKSCSGLNELLKTKGWSLPEA